MDCAGVQDRLSDYLEEKGEGADLAAVAAHIEGCRECAAAAEGLKATLAELRELPRHKAPRELLDSVLSGIASDGGAGPVRPRASRSSRLRIPIEAAAAVLLILLVYGAYGLRREAPFSPSPGTGASAVRAPEAARPAGVPPAEEAGKAAPPHPARAPSAGSPPEAERGSPGSASDRQASEAPGGSGAARSVEAAAPATLAKAPTAATGGRGEARRRATLPAVPATRASTLREPVGPPPWAEPSADSGRGMTYLILPPRVLRPLRSVREVILEVAPERLEGIEDRIAEAARRRGGVHHEDDFVRAARPGTGTLPAPMRIYLPAGAADAFLEDLGAMGTIEPETHAAAAPPPASAAEVVPYTVRFRVR